MSYVEWLQERHQCNLLTLPVELLKLLKVVCKLNMPIEIVFEKQRSWLSGFGSSVDHRCYCRRYTGTPAYNVVGSFSLEVSHKQSWTAALSSSFNAFEIRCLITCPLVFRLLGMSVFSIFSFFLFNLLGISLCIDLLLILWQFSGVFSKISMSVAKVGLSRNHSKPRLSSGIQCVALAVGGGFCVCLFIMHFCHSSTLFLL